MRRDVNKLLLEIGIDFTKFYAATGLVLRIEDLYQKDTIEMLRKNYKSTSLKFLDYTRESLEKKDIPLNSNKLILNNLQNYIDNHSKQQSTYILHTTQKEIRNDLQNVIAISAASGIYLNQKEIAKQTKDKFLARNEGRSALIASTEVVNISETAKQIEAKSLIDLDAKYQGELLKDSINKTWVTFGDEKVRLSHLQAEGQQVEVDEPFTVQGEELMYPGDTSLGASLDNIINCRCRHFTKEI
jgi:hypothetical protein